MDELTVLGLPLEADEDDDIRDCTPLCAVVILKALDSNGEVRYYTSATAGLKSVEALGMVRYAGLKLEHGLVDNEEG